MIHDTHQAMTHTFLTWTPRGPSGSATSSVLLAQTEMDDGHHHLKQQLLHPIQQRATITFILHTVSSPGHIASNGVMISEK
jgi:hypothetical protein